MEALVATVGYEVVLATSDAGVARLLNFDLPVPTCPEISDHHVSLIDKGLLAMLCAKRLSTTRARTGHAHRRRMKRRLAASEKR